MKPQITHPAVPLWLWSYLRGEKKLRWSSDRVGAAKSGWTAKKMRGETYLSLANTELNTVTRSSSPVLTSTPLKLREWKKRRRKSHGYLKQHNLHIACSRWENNRVYGWRGGEEEERKRRGRGGGGEWGEGEKMVRRRWGEGEKGKRGRVHTAALYVWTKKGGERENGGIINKSQVLEAGGTSSAVMWTRCFIFQGWIKSILYNCLKC